MDVVIAVFVFIWMIDLSCKVGKIGKIQMAALEELKEIKIRTGRF